MEDLMQEISKSYNLSIQVVRLLFLRGIDTKEKIDKFLNPSFEDFGDPFELSGMREAVERIKNAVEKQQRVLIFGDYDVDGVSATAILLRYFKDINFAADFYLPNRYTDGYGLTCTVLDKIKQQSDPELIITVDCGISCHKEVEYAKKLGMDIIITDHHEIPELIPNTVVIDPKLSGQAYSFDGLCGAGVALKLVQALGGLEAAKKYLAICAIATIADIVPLVDENRAIVALGLKALSTLPLGIKILMQRNKLDNNASASDIAFRLAPKINAAGRMGNAAVALNLYLDKDKKTLEGLAHNLMNLNTERQRLCNKMYDEAARQLDGVSLSEMRAIVLSSKEWDSGIVGIVAARIAEEYNRPAVLLGEVDGVLKGSARSINNIDIYSAIANTKQTLEAFGGHKMAAGLTIKSENIEKFTKSLNSTLDSKYTQKDYLPVIDYDMQLNIDEINHKFMSDLGALEPCGCANPKPAFNVTLNKFSVSVMPTNPSHITILAGGFNIVAFGSGEYLPVLKNAKQVDLSLELQSHVYNRRTYLKGIVRSIRIKSLSLKKNDDFSGGVYLKQFLKRNTIKSSAYGKVQLPVTLEQVDRVSTNDIKCEEYDEEKLGEIIEQAEKDKFGTLFVASTNQTYENFNTLGSEIHMLEVVSRSGLNAVVLSWMGLKNFNCFSKIVCLDPVLSQNYIRALSSFGAKIYIPKTKFDKTIFAGLEYSRERFLEYFRVLKAFANQKVPLLNEVYLYKKLKTLNPDKKLSYKQFIYCLYTFFELKLFESEICEGGFLLKPQKIEVSLENSQFYNTIKLILETI